MTFRKHVTLGLLCLALIGLSSCGKDGPPGSLPVSQIQFALQPVNTPQGTTFNVSVVFLNELGHLVQVDGESATLSLETNPAGGTLAGATAVNTRLGVCYFFDSLSIDALGNGYRLRATSGQWTAVSDLFDIIAPTKLAFTLQPTSAVVSQPFSVKVEARDDNDKRVPIDGLDVTVSILTNPAGGILSGNTASTTNKGVALFPNLLIDQIGAGYTLMAQAGPISAISAPLEIVAAPPPGGGGPLPPTHVKFTSFPANVTAGVPFSVTVEVRDMLDNLVPTAANAITVALEADGGSRLMHASGFPSSSLEYINPTDASTISSLPSTSGEVNCLHFHAPTGMVYASDISGLYYSYDPSSGAETSLGGGNQLHGMAWDTVGNRIVAVSRDDSNLYTFDPITGSSSVVGGLTAGPFNGLAAHPTTGTIYGVLDGFPRQLCTVNPATLNVTTIGSMGDQVADISFRPDGTLFAIIGDGGGASEFLYTVDLNSGGLSAVGQASTGNDGEAIGFVGSSFAGTQNKNAVSGTATFTDLVLDTPGTGFRLTATSPGLTPDVSANFTVDP